MNMGEYDMAKELIRSVAKWEQMEVARSIHLSVLSRQFKFDEINKFLAHIYRLVKWQISANVNRDKLVQAETYLTKDAVSPMLSVLLAYIVNICNILPYFVVVY